MICYFYAGLIVMRNLKTFEEYQPVRKRNMFEWGLPKIDQEINDIIWESMGVSDDVDLIVKDLVEQITDCIDNGEYERFNQEDDIDFTNNELANKADIYKLEQTFTSHNIVFITNCRLMNYSNMTDKEFGEVSTLNVLAHIRKLAYNRFILTCYVPTRDFKLSQKGISVLNHEIMHSWQSYNKNIDNKKEKEYSEWNQLYKNATTILLSKPDDILSKSIYYGDLRELCAFTQQAYYELEDVDDIDEVHTKIKKLDIYKGLRAVRDGMKYLEEHDIPERFNKITKKKLIYILKKRYDKYERNIARLILARKEVLEENLKYMDITKQELMLIWS
jgi:hypothetical protein